VRPATKHDGAMTRLSDSQITWVSGTVAALAATFAKQPIQRVKWIQQTSPGPLRSYGSIITATMQSHGWRGFFGGSWAAVCRNVPHSVIVYTLYPHCARACAFAEKETFASRFAAGYVTMVLSTLVTHPLDTLRVRIAVAGARHDTLVSSARAIYKADGASGFYSGFSATIVGAGPRGAVGFAIFETAKPKTHLVPGLGDRPGLAKFLCGYLAGLVAETVVYPLDTVRRRQQAFAVSHPINRLSSFAALLLIARTEGIPGLFKGVALNLVKNPAATAVSFAVNDAVKDALGYGRPASTGSLHDEEADHHHRIDDEESAGGKPFQAAAAARPEHRSKVLRGPNS